MSLANYHFKLVTVLIIANTYFLIVRFYYIFHISVNNSFLYLNFTIKIIDSSYSYTTLDNINYCATVKDHIILIAFTEDY